MSQRAVYVEDASDRFWNSVDEYLGKIRSKADTPEKLVRCAVRRCLLRGLCLPSVARAFKHILNEDRKTHGSALECDISDEYGADEFQQRVDDTIDDPKSTLAGPATQTPLRGAGAVTSTTGTAETPLASSDTNATDASIGTIVLAAGAGGSGSA